jgi:ribosomal protein S18 acetylase RimI-like enzyme
MQRYAQVMRIEKALPAEAPLVMEIIDLCRKHMRAGGSEQWNDLYPRLEIVQEDADSGSLYVLRDGDADIGAVCLNELQPPEYKNLGWRYTAGPALTIHRLCVRPDCQAKGAARELMDFAEAFALQKHYHAIRLDTYTGNPRALALYDKRGYERVGETVLGTRRLPVIVFEKRVSTSSCSSAVSSEQKPGTGADCPA